VLETDAFIGSANRSWDKLDTQPLVVDIATLPDLLTPMVTSFTASLSPSHSLGFEWCQALIQYLQTGGFRSMMARSWAEVLQQIRQQSVDLLLICLGESKNRTAVLGGDLGQQHKVPPVLVLDQRLSQGEVSKELHQATTEPDEVDS